MAELRIGTATKALFWIIGAAFAVAIGANYFHFFVSQDFTVSKQISCNPAIESCFVSECQSNDSTCDSTPYKKLVILSREIGPVEYEALQACPTNSLTCKVVTCDATTFKEGEICSK